MACVSFLQGFNTSCGSNLSSIKKIWVGEFEGATFTYNYQKGENGQNVLDQDGNEIIESVAGVTVNPDRVNDVWVEFGFKKNTSEMTTEMTRNDNGSYFFTNSANLVFAKQDKVKRLAIQATASGECTMIILDSNGIYWLIGADNPVSASTVSATTGVAVGDANQYSLTLSADEAYMPIPLDKDEAQTIINTLVGTTSNSN